MVYTRVKWIKGKPYYYEQKSYRVGNQIKTKHIRYIPKGRSSSGKNIPDSPSRATEEKIIKRNIVTASKLDKRPNRDIARDMQQNSEVVYDKPSKVDDWAKNKDRSDLKGWDTTHIKAHVESHEEMQPKVEHKLKRIYPKAEVTGRTKELPSAVGKIKKKNKDEPFTHYDMQDISGTRVTVKDIKSEKDALVKLRKNFKIIEVEDYVSHPNKANYRSIHAIIEYNGKPVELQIRTKNQTIWADWGHDTLYKNTEKTKKRLGEKGWKQANAYSKDMAEYYYAKDRGIKANKPQLPSELKGKVKEMPD